MAWSDKWAEAPSNSHCVKAEFVDGSVSYTTIEHAADALDFIDRDLGIQALRDGAMLRSHLGTYYSVVPTDVR